MAVKKAAKKALKKAAKKSFGKHHKHEDGKDLRRAYEHLGRLESLESVFPKNVPEQIAALTDLSRRTLQEGDARSSAELFRACEHIAFGVLSPDSKDSVNGALRDAIGKQYDKLHEEALEEWENRGDRSAVTISRVFRWALSMAESAYANESFRRSLEMIRAAAVLARVDYEGLPKLSPNGKKPKLLP